jgi:hypothetical protein
MNFTKNPQRSPKDEIIGFSFMKNIIKTAPRSPQKVKPSNDGSNSPRSPRSPRGDVIIINPLKNIINILPKNPDWSCNHEGLEIINHNKKMFRCEICNKKGKVIKRYYQKEIVSAISSITDEK